MRFVKKFFYIILCICAFGFTEATEQVERNMQPFFIVFVCLCIVGAVLLPKKHPEGFAAPRVLSNFLTRVCVYVRN